MFWFDPKKKYWFNPTDYGVQQSQASMKPASFQVPTIEQFMDNKNTPITPTPNKNLLEDSNDYFGKELYRIENLPKWKPQPTQQVPQQAMQTYAPAIENESRTYKGLSTEDETKLMKLAGGSSSKADMLYPKLLQYKQDNLFLQDRKIKLQEAQLEAIQSGDKRQKETTNQMVKIGQLADFIREDALKNGALWVSMKADEEIVNSILAKADTNTSNKLLTEYFNGNTDTETVANVLLGRQQTDIGKPSTIENVAEGAFRFSAWLPWIIAETWILDKPAEYLARWVAKLTGKKFDENAPSFSESFKASATGWDPESAVAKWVETWLDVAGMVGGVAGAIGWIKQSKALASKIAKNKSAKVTQLIAEPETKRNIQTALRQERLSQSTKWKIKTFLFGDKRGDIVPTAKLQKAQDVIVKEIAKPADNVAWLYKQVDELVTTKSKTIEPILSSIEVPKSTVKNTKVLDVKRYVKELSKNDEFTSSQVKDLNRLYTNFSQSKNLNGMWKSRIDWDKSFSQAVKSVDPSNPSISPATRKAYELWKSGRNAMNDIIEEIAKSKGSNVKSVWDEMSSLYEALRNMENSVWIQNVKKIDGVLSPSNVVKWAAGVVGASYLANKLTE